MGAPRRLVGRSFVGLHWFVRRAWRRTFSTLAAGRVRVLRPRERARAAGAARGPVADRDRQRRLRRRGLLAAGAGRGRARPSRSRSATGRASPAAASCRRSRSCGSARRVLLARNVYIADHAHAFEDTTRAVLDQGIDRRPPGRDRRRRLARPERRRLPRRADRPRARSSAPTAVVRDDVPDYAVAVGAPARVVREFGRVAQPVAVRRVLFLAYHFPPIGGAGVQRSAKFVRDLPAHGYEPIVVTGPGFEASRWTPVDRSLEQDVPRGRPSAGSPTQPPPSPGAWRGRADRWLGLQEPFFALVGAGRRGAGGRGGPADLVYASMSPFESGAAAARIAAKRGDPVGRRPPRPVGARRDAGVPEPRSTGGPTGAACAASCARPPRSSMNTPRRPRGASPRFPALGAHARGPDPERLRRRRLRRAGARRGRTTRSASSTPATCTPSSASGTRGAARAARCSAAPTRASTSATRSHVYLLQALERLLAEDPRSPAGRAPPRRRAVRPRPRRGRRRDARRRRTATSPTTRRSRSLRSADLLFLPMHDLPRGRARHDRPGQDVRVPRVAAPDPRRRPRRRRPRPARGTPDGDRSAGPPTSTR